MLHCHVPWFLNHTAAAAFYTYLYIFIYLYVSVYRRYIYTDIEIIYDYKCFVLPT